MKALVILLSYAIITAYANHSAHHERCQILQSVANTDNAGNLVECSVDQSCFSLNCKPSLPEDSEFHIIVEPCKHPAAILVNGSISGNEYSHEFTHNETVDIPYTSPIGTPQLVVVIDNSDNTTLVFSVQLILSGINPITIVPETNFPLDNITCMNGHVVTSEPTPQYTTVTTHGHATYSCMETCVAIHKMVAKTNSLCKSTENCLTINCNSPNAIALIANVTSSYTIEPCQSPPTILARFDDHSNDQHFSENITKDTIFSLPFSIPGNPQIQVTLEDPDDYSILFGVNLIVLGQTTPVLPRQRIPIDKSGCPGYTGPTVNPYCTTQQTETTKTVTTHSTPVHSHTNPDTHVITPSHNQTAAVNSNAGKLAGIIVGVLLILIVTVGVAILVTAGIVYFVMKRKSKVVYTYSHFQALEEDD